MSDYYKEDRIYEYISNNPGLNTREIITGLGISFGGQEYLDWLDSLISLNKKGKLNRIQKGKDGIDTPLWSVK